MIHNVRVKGTSPCARAFRSSLAAKRRLFVEYVNPHVLVRMRATDDTARIWLAVLAPPSRMTRRGLPQDSVRVGQIARLYGYPHRQHADEMRAERITIDDRTTELR